MFLLQSPMGIIIVCLCARVCVRVCGMKTADCSKHTDILFTIIYDKEKLEILTFEKLKN